MATTDTTGTHNSGNASLFTKLADTVARFTSSNPGTQNWIKNTAVKTGTVDVTAFTGIARRADVHPLPNGSLMFSFTSRDDKVYNHNLNWNDATERARLETIIDDKTLSDRDRFRLLTDYFTKMGASVKISADFNNGMSQNNSEKETLHR